MPEMRKSILSRSTLGHVSQGGVWGLLKDGETYCGNGVLLKGEFEHTNIRLKLRGRSNRRTERRQRWGNRT
jgi:hypothetical protein